jgi:hypothetical protein
MVTIRTCASLPDAQVVQSHLRGSGIEAFLPDELTVQFNWLWANAIGGVRVQVPEEDAERAVEILEDESASHVQEAAKSCSHCGAALKATYGLGPYVKALVALLFSLPMRSKPTWKCPGCGKA